MAFSPSAAHTDLLSKLHGSYNPEGYAFYNPKQMIAKHLLDNGFLVADHATVDPTDAAKVAMQLTASGLDHIGKGGTDAPAPVPTAAAPAQPSFAAAGVPATPDVAASQATAAPSSKTGPRIAPQIAAPTGFRFAALPTRENGARAKGTRTETYPFEKLAAPDASGFDSFFVHATDTMPNPGKTLTGTVTSANKRYKDKGASFKLVPVDVDAEHGVKGARILRLT